MRNAFVPLLLLACAACSEGALVVGDGDGAHVPLDDGALVEDARPRDAAPVTPDAAPFGPDAGPGLTDAALADDAAAPLDAWPAPDADGPDVPPEPEEPDAGDPHVPPEPDAAVPPPPPACPFTPGREPQKKAVFVDRYPDEDLDIENELLRLFEAATPGSQIRVALYTFTRGHMADGLVAAARRGVDVRVVLDESNQTQDPPGSGSWRYSRAVERLVAGLGADRVTICNGATPPDGGGCQGPGINHNKFFLFSALCDGSRHVVVQSSANLTNPQIREHNNLVVVRDDPGLHAAYLAYWNDLRAQRMRPDYYHSVDGSTGTKAYFYPRAGRTVGRDPNTDTVHRILTNNVECAGGTEVRVMMAYWSQARGYLVDDLAALHRAGCDVRVLVDATASTAALQRNLRDSLPAARVRIVEGIHSKYLLVDGRYLGQRRRLVWTGSHNYTGPALRENDEALMRIDDRAIFDAFRANWQRAWDTLGR